MIKYRCDQCGKESEWKSPTGSREREHEPFPVEWRKTEGNYITAWRSGILHFCSTECLDSHNVKPRERGKYPTFGG